MVIREGFYCSDHISGKRAQYESSYPEQTANLILMVFPPPLFPLAPPPVLSPSRGSARPYPSAGTVGHQMPRSDCPQDKAVQLVKCCSCAIGTSPQAVESMSGGLMAVVFKPHQRERGREGVNKRLPTLNLIRIEPGRELHFTGN